MVNGFTLINYFFTALFYLPIQLFCILLEVIVFIIPINSKKQNSKIHLILIIIKCIFTCKLLIFIIYNYKFQNKQAWVINTSNQWQMHHFLCATHHTTLVQIRARHITHTMDADYCRMYFSLINSPVILCRNASDMMNLSQMNFRSLCSFSLNNGLIKELIQIAIKQCGHLAICINSVPLLLNEEVYQKSPTTTH